MKKNHFFTFIFISSILFFSNCSKSNNSLSNPGRVSVERGMVYSAINNSPLENVTVTISGIVNITYHPFENAPVLTDSKGYFVIGVGGHDSLYLDTVHFSKQGYYDTSFSVYPYSQNITATYSGYDTIRMRQKSVAKLK